MKVIDAFWEKRNLGISVCEVSVENEENGLDLTNELRNLFRSYEYLVVKIPPKRLDLVHLLEVNGFIFMETQLNIARNTKDPIKDIPNGFTSEYSFDVVEDENLIMDIASNIELGMFATDRVCLDPALGDLLSRNRYRNWLLDIYKSEKSVVLSLMSASSGQRIGFSAIKLTRNSAQYLLGGVFLEHQGLFKGLNVVLQPLLYCQQKGIKKIRSQVSSNNGNIIRLYSELGFSITHVDYVLRGVKNECFN